MQRGCPATDERMRLGFERVLLQILSLLGHCLFPVLCGRTLLVTRVYVNPNFLIPPFPLW